MTKLLVAYDKQWNMVPILPLKIERIEGLETFLGFDKNNQDLAFLMGMMAAFPEHPSGRYASVWDPFEEAVRKAAYALVEGYLINQKIIDKNEKPYINLKKLYSNGLDFEIISNTKKISEFFECEIKTSLSLRKDSLKSKSSLEIDHLSPCRTEGYVRERYMVFSATILADFLNVLYHKKDGIEEPKILDHFRWYDITHDYSRTNSIIPENASIEIASIEHVKTVLNDAEKFYKSIKSKEELDKLTAMKREIIFLTYPKIIHPIASSLLQEKYSEDLKSYLPKQQT
jgi:hypothetical protein